MGEASDATIIAFQKRRRGRTALDILDQRYGEGEITRDEYARIKEDLNRKDPRF